MSSLLQVLLSLVGTALVLALAAQSLQEILKVMFALKGKARIDAIKGLLHESGKASGLSKEQVRRLREEYSIYTIDTGRVCIAALTTGNVDYVADAIAKVIR